MQILLGSQWTLEKNKTSIVLFSLYDIFQLKNIWILNASSDWINEKYSERKHNNRALSSNEIFT